MICFRIARISDWISDSGLGALLLHIHPLAVVQCFAQTKEGPAYDDDPALPSSGCSRRCTSNTHLSKGVRVSLDMIASTNCVTEPVRSHSVWSLSKHSVTP